MSIKTTNLITYELFRRSEYRLDEYVLHDGKKHPFAIICPGGAYRMIASHVEGIPFAEELNKRGYSAFILWYGNRKKAKYPLPMQDLARALKDILSRAEELELDTGNYSVWGSSAGGHLAAAFGTDNMGAPLYNLPKPNALVLIYPVVTMGEHAHQGSKMRLIGKHAPEEQVKFASIEKNISDDFPPTFIWCGEKDKCVEPVNSKMLKEALDEKGIANELNIYPNVGHGVGLGRNKTCADWFERAVAFWENSGTKK